LNLGEDNQGEASIAKAKEAYHLQESPTIRYGDFLLNEATTYGANKMSEHKLLAEFMPLDILLPEATK